MKMKEKNAKDEFINVMKESIVPAMLEIASDDSVEITTRMAFSSIGNVIKDMLSLISEEDAA